MSRHKKTREQKIIADLRRKIELQKPISNTPDVQTSVSKTFLFQTVVSLAKSAPAFAYDHTNLKPDLFKTLTLTAAIIVSLLMLFFLLKTHIFAFPWGSY